MKTNTLIRSSKARQRISLLIRKAGPLISTGDASKILGIPASKASMTLSKWVKQGWLKRLKRGVYAPISIEANSSEQVLNNVWVLVPRMFGAAYIGGWSAAEYWGLTEQLFQRICVITPQNVRKRNVIIQNISFYLKHVKGSLLFGLKSVWHQNVKIQISDPHKTIIDMLDNPSLGGGIHHVDSCLRAYLTSNLCDELKLLEYAEKQHNGALFKRLGYLVSHIDSKRSHLIKFCKEHITKGLSSLEPGYKDVRIVTEWRLKIPKNWQEDIGRD